MGRIVKANPELYQDMLACAMAYSDLKQSIEQINKGEIIIYTQCQNCLKIVHKYNNGDIWKYTMYPNGIIDFDMMGNVN